MQRLPDKRVQVLATLALTLFLLLSFKRESIWTDEAFSAFVACRSSVQSVWHTLAIGDSSDLQMWLYYIYLHDWVSVFGCSELALRSANIPFVFLYSASVVWIRTRMFASNWVFVAALSPMIWAYAGDARPYMIVISLSTVFVACLVMATDTRYSDSAVLPWIALSALLVGMNMHMLTVLIVPPAFIFLLIYARFAKSGINLKPWRLPLLLLSPLFLAYFVFIAWTFTRGVNYDYEPPKLFSMASVLFRFIGLAGFSPNRHYDVSFSPYILGMVLSAISFLSALAVAAWPALRSGHARTIALLAALLAGILETFVLTFVFHKQIDVRHAACLFALLLFFLFSAWHFSQRTIAKRYLLMTASVLAAVWLISDLRFTFLPDYRREDFRSSVAAITHLAAIHSTDIAVVADPAAVAYYGVRVTGPKPCFPLPGTCDQALGPLTWPALASGSFATFWTPQKISHWLAPLPHSERLLLISRSRHPMYLNSEWWNALKKYPASQVIPFHGFWVCVFRPGKY